MSQNATPIDVVALAAELATIQDRQKQLAERESAIKDVLRSLGEGKHIAGNLSVVVSPNRRVDADKVKAAFPIVEFPHFYIQAPKLDTIKASIAPLMYENLMSPVGKAKVMVK